MPNQKTAVVTGANQGLGLEVVRQLAEKGFRVYLTARSSEAGQKAADLLARPGRKVRFIPLDVTDAQSVKRAAREIAADIDHVDLLINNAGIFPDGQSSILNIDEALLEKSFRTNTVGPVLVSQAFLPLLSKSKQARILNVSSGLGALEDMGSMAPSYSISKTALNAVTRQLAAALKENKISVNSVCPGWVRTRMGGEGATRSIDEGVEGIVWLATEAPAELTGSFVRDRAVIPW